MIFVDTSVMVYAVGGEHPLKAEARGFFEDALEWQRPLATSAAVLQELAHAYLPVDRVATLDRALELADGLIAEVWTIEPEDVRLARLLIDVHPALGARDLLHLACCQRREVYEIKTFHRALGAAFGGPS